MPIRKFNLRHRQDKKRSRMDRRYTLTCKGVRALKQLQAEKEF